MRRVAGDVAIYLVLAGVTVGLGLDCSPAEEQRARAVIDDVCYVLTDRQLDTLIVHLDDAGAKRVRDGGRE